MDPVEIKKLEVMVKVKIGVKMRSSRGNARKNPVYQLPMSKSEK